MNVPMPPDTSRAPDWLYRFLVTTGVAGVLICLVVELAGVETEGAAHTMAVLFGVVAVNAAISWGYVRSRRGRRAERRHRRGR